MLLHVFDEAAICIRRSPEVFLKGGVLGHLPDVLPIFICWEAHDTEYPVQLVVVEGVTGLNVLLATVEDGLGRQQLRKDAANRPNVCIR